MVYIRWYRKYSFKKQVNLGDDGEITASSVNDRPYSGGAYTAYPGTDVSGVIEIIDDVADDDAEKLYEIIYNHILNSSRKKDKAYINIAVHCAEKMKLPGEKLYEDFQTHYPVRLNYDEIDAYVKRREDFRARLEFFGIKERYDENFIRVWCDPYGEIVSVEEPNNQDKNGKWEYMNLPIRELKRIPYDYETMKNYSKRCQMLKSQLEGLGIHRDVRRHIYCDKEGREVKIELPNYDNKNDFGSFSYVERKDGRDEYR